jgi:hypothetical protein
MARCTGCQGGAGWMNAGVCVLSYLFAYPTTFHYSLYYSTLQSNSTYYSTLQSGELPNVRVNKYVFGVLFFSCGFGIIVNFGNSLK